MSIAVFVHTITALKTKVTPFTSWCDFGNSSISSWLDNFIMNSLAPILMQLPITKKKLNFKCRYLAWCSSADRSYLNKYLMYGVHFWYLSCNICYKTTRVPSINSPPCINSFSPSKETIWSRKPNVTMSLNINKSLNSRLFLSKFWALIFVFLCSVAAKQYNRFVI